MATALAANWKGRLDSLRMRLIEFESGYIYLEADEDEREQPVEDLVMILREAIALYRDVRDAGLDNVAQMAHNTINKGIDIWAGRDGQGHIRENHFSEFADITCNYK